MKILYSSRRIVEITPSTQNYFIIKAVLTTNTDVFNWMHEHIL